MKRELPIRAIFDESVNMMFARTHDLFRLGWPYLGISLVYWQVTEEIIGRAQYFLFSVVAIFSSVLAIVACHRVFLLGREEVEQTMTFRWGYRETKFLINIVGISFLAGLLVLPVVVGLQIVTDVGKLWADEGSILGFVVFAILYLPATYVMSRLSLILPDIAVDNDRTLAWAWALSSGHSFSLFILIGLLPILTSLVTYPLFLLMGGSFIAVFLQFVIWTVVAVLEICLLSLSYAWLMSAREDSGASA